MPINESPRPKTQDKVNLIISKNTNYYCHYYTIENAELKKKDTFNHHYLIKLNSIGFKIVPLGKDGKTPALSVDEIYCNPYYWNEEKIKKDYHLFKNIATTYGKTHIKDKEGRSLYLNEFNIKSEDVFTRLCILKIKDKEIFFIDRLCKITYIIKTKERFGYRFFWFSHHSHNPISEKNCKRGYEFEIKTDKSLGIGILPPCTDNHDETFTSQSIGQESIAIIDKMHSELLNLLQDYLI